MKIPLIPYQYIKKPNSLLGKWIRLPNHYQWLIMITVLFSTAVLCLFYCYPQQQLSEQLYQQWKQKQYDVSHQQQLLTMLQHKIQQTQLTPEIVNQLSPINSYVQQQLPLNHLALLQSKWQYFSRPHLTLKIQGAYPNFSLFLSSLLQQFPALKLNQLTIQQAEGDTLQQIQSISIFILE